ncbi:MAG: ABC transporter ATP-binding protein [Synergistes sp.]|nr:ABC transporter ATP-binding protein [Synergistes sp.]
MGKVVIDIKNLTKKFGNFTAVDNISMQIEEGEVYGFLGPNGAGKSTTIKMLCGLLAPTSGQGLILGLNLARSGQALKKQVGYMSQKFSLYPDMTVLENLELYSGLYGLSGEYKRKRIEAMVELAGLTGREEELTGSLSGGWRQRLALGCAILHEPKILFLDEATSGVDPKARLLFWDIIYDLAAGGCTVMVTTHFMDEAEHCNKVAFIYYGKLIANDSPEALKASIPGKLYEIGGRDPMAMLADVQAGKAGAVIDSYFFGDKIHLLVAKDKTITADGIFSGCSIKEINQTMEDVFVYLVKSHANEELGDGRISGIGNATTASAAAMGSDTEHSSADEGKKG